MTAPSEVIERAHQLYLTGAKDSTIAHDIARELNFSCTASMVRNWASWRGWRAERLALKTKALDRLHERAISATEEQTTGHIDRYQKIQETAEQALENVPEDGVVVRNAKDLEHAARALDLGIQGERRIQAGIFATQFVLDILAVLTEEVKDENTMRRIGVRLRQLAAKQQDLAPETR